MGMGIAATAIPKYAVPVGEPVKGSTLAEAVVVKIKNSVPDTRVAVFKGLGEEREMIAQGVTNIDGIAEFLLDGSLVGEEVEVVARKAGLLPVRMQDMELGHDGLDITMVAVEDRVYNSDPEESMVVYGRSQNYVVDTFGLPFSLIPPWRRS